MKIKWINHKGKRILYIDYSGLSDKEMIQQLDEGSAMMLKEKDPILYFGNFSNTIITNEFMNKANVWGKETKAKTEKMAVVGLTSGVRSILLNTYNMLTGAKMKVFSTEQEALDYLAQ
jgi:hypothetical protein